MALIQTNAQLLVAPQTGGFINSGFTASGEYDTYMPFTATQKQVYTATVETVESVPVVFNDGSWNWYQWQLGFAITASSDLVNCLQISALSAHLTFLTAPGGSLNSYIRYCYNSFGGGEVGQCGRWYRNDFSDTAMTAVINGFGDDGALPTAYPVYLTFEGIIRGNGETSPITVSAISGIGEPEPAYPQYPLTSTGYFSTRTFCTGTLGQRASYDPGIYPITSGWHSAATRYESGPDSASTTETWSGYRSYPYYSDTWMCEIANGKKYDFRQDTGYTYTSGAVQTAWHGYPSDSGSITP